LIREYLLWSRRGRRGPVGGDCGVTGSSSGGEDEVVVVVAAGGGRWEKESGW